MSILKLLDVGAAATLNVVKCEQVEGEYGEQVKFTADTGDILYLPMTSATRQLERCRLADGTGILYDEVAGTTLHFSRTASNKPNGKPYWNIDLATPAEARPKPEPKRMQAPPKANDAPAAAPPADAETWPHLVATFGTALADARKLWTPETDEDVIYKTAFTLWQQATQKRVTIPTAAPAKRVPSPFAAPKGRDLRDPLPDPEGDDLESEIPF